MDLLADNGVLAALRQAWLDSQADSPLERHEEGGYIVRDSGGGYHVERWPRGGESRIAPPTIDPKGCYNGRVVLAVFHTHPNRPVDETGREWEQGPSQSDVQWHVRRKLTGWVVGWTTVYEIGPDGTIAVAGERNEVIGI